MSEEVIFTWRRVRGSCVGLICQGAGCVLTPGDAPHIMLAVLLLARPPSQSDCGLLVVILTYSLQLELHTSPPAHLFMTNYIMCRLITQCPSCING